MITIPLDVESYPTLVYAIIGRGFLSMTEANMLEEEGFAIYSGDQHNPDWRWNLELLESLPNETLLEILTRTE